MTRMSKVVALAVMTLTVTTFAEAAPQATTPPPKPQTTAPPLPTSAPPKPAPVLPFPADSKIGFVNMQQLLSDSELGKAGYKEIEKASAKWTTQLTELNKQATQKQNEIDSQSSLLQPSALNAKVNELEKLKTAIERMKQDAQADVGGLNEQLLTSFQEKVMPIINTLCTEKGLYVLHVLDPQNPTVAFINPALDLTVEIIKAIDKKYPAGK